MIVRVDNVPGRLGILVDDVDEGLRVGHVQPSVLYITSSEYNLIIFFLYRKIALLFPLSVS